MILCNQNGWLSCRFSQLTKKGVQEKKKTRMTWSALIWKFSIVQINFSSNDFLGKYTYQALSKLHIPSFKYSDYKDAELQICCVHKRNFG